MRIENGLVFDGTAFDAHTVHTRGARFAADSSDDHVIDASGCYVIPGLIDIHFHGCMGHDFCEGTDEAIDILSRYEASCGITAMCPATMTYPEEKLAGIAQAAAAHTDAPDGAALVGLNMEGPFISPDKMGAQNPAYVQACNAQMFERLQEAAGGLIKLVDIAPEEPGAMEFIRAYSDSTRISLAHMCASYEIAAEAFEAGARQVTHLFNAMPALHHRAPGPIAAAALREDVTVELIADGIHIHPAMVQLAFKLFGLDRVILISDSMMATGMKDGMYTLGGQDVQVSDGRATLADGTIAGSTTNLARCLQIAVHDMDIPVEDAVRAATVNPARALGIDDTRGRIACGYIADAVILDAKTLAVQHVILRGQVL